MFREKEQQALLPVEFKILKYILKNKKLKKIIKKPEYEYGRVQIGLVHQLLQKQSLASKEKSFTLKIKSLSTRSYNSAKD